MDNPALLTLVLAAGGGLMVAGLLALHRLKFVIRVVPGDVRVRRGRPPADFVEGCRDLCRRHGLRRGSIRCVHSAQGQRLTFSRDIPPELHQRFRNIWTPPPPGGGGGGRRAAG